MHIVVKRGLDIPIEGKPKGKTLPLSSSVRGMDVFSEKRLGLDLTAFSDHRFSLLVEEGQEVKVGEPLVEVRGREGLYFVSPAGGKVVEIRKGLKRALQAIVIEKNIEEAWFEHSPLNGKDRSKEAILERIKNGGAIPYISQRPFDLLPDPQIFPRSIFVSAIESLPFSPPVEETLKGHEELFQQGLEALFQICPDAVHLIRRKECSYRILEEAKNVIHHTVEGPHPSGNGSLHIQEIDPIRGVEDVRWVLNVRTVILIGSLVSRGRFFYEKVIGIGGSGFVSDQVGFFKTREGISIGHLIQGRLPSHPQARVISGDVLVGKACSPQDFLRPSDFSLVAIPEPDKREFLHFFRLGGSKYSFSGAYLSGHIAPPEEGYFFSTSQHGEERAFVDGTLYDKVNPLKVPTMELIKAIMARDFEAAEELGFWSVVPEDFALPTFVCPSKMPMIDIVREGISAYLKE